MMRLEDPAMLPSLLAAVLSILATLGFGLTLLSLLRYQTLTPTLKLGSALITGSVIISQAIKVLAWLGTTLWVGSLLMVTTGVLLLLPKINKYFQITPAGSFLSRGLLWPHKFLEHKPIDYVTIFFLALISIHFIFILTANFTQSFFPWDAFTTWIYRSKLWVLNNEIISLTAAADWFDASGKSGYALHASSYPDTASLYPAFVSSLSGRWNPVIAAVPWSVIFIAICLTGHGIFKSSGVTNRQALIGTYLLASLPLLNIHAALAGYADLWVVALSGNGLCLLLIWHLTKKSEYLSLGMILLVAGTQIKYEGWIWLFAGLTFLLSIQIKLRFFLVGVGLLFCVSAYAWLFDTLSFNLGALGIWGLHDNVMHFGRLGQYPVRLYNPSAAYFRVFVDRSNFHFAGLAFLVSVLILLSRSAHRGLAIFYLTFITVFLNLIIFGVSTYSFYAEIGTAISRFLLQLSPLALLFVVLAWQALDQENKKRELAYYKRPSTLSIIGIAKNNRRPILLLAIVCSSQFIFLSIVGFSTAQKPVEFSATDLITIVGESRTTSRGVVFTKSSVGLGVLKAPLQTLAVPPPQYLQTNITTGGEGGVSFYWIPESNKQVQSIPVEVSGPFLTDLNEISDWRDQKILEFGFLVDAENFANITIHELGLHSVPSIQWVPALLNTWTSPHPLSQKLINSNPGHQPAPISFSLWLHITCISLICLHVFLKLLGTDSFSLRSFTASLLVLWMVSDVLFLSNFASTLHLSVNKVDDTITGRDPKGHALLQLESEIKKLGAADSPVLVVSMGQEAEFAAQKFPYLLLPRRALFVRENWLRNMPLNWHGLVVLLGSNSDKIDAAVARLAENYSFISSVVSDDCVVLEIGRE